MWLRRQGEKKAGTSGRSVSPPQAREVQCPLCGNRFDPAESEACAHCPRLFKSCGMVVCPRCSHEFVLV